MVYFVVYRTRSVGLFWLVFTILSPCQHHHDLQYQHHHGHQGHQYHVQHDQEAGGDQGAQQHWKDQVVAFWVQASRSSGKNIMWSIFLHTCAYFHPSLDARRKKTFLDKLNSLLHSHQPWDCVKTWRERLIREDFTIFHHHFAQCLEIYHSFRKLTSYRVFF